jgi:hypothetical protein
MKIDEPEEIDRLLKKPEIKRDEMGRFEQHGAGLIKKGPTIKKPDTIKNPKGHGGLRAGAGRPRGSKNKISLALRMRFSRAALIRGRPSVLPASTARLRPAWIR